MEAKRKNVYFNKRLFIDDMGNLKNTLTSDLSFGNILDLKNRTAFVELIKQYSFQQYWHITKDMITVCRDCELRYMCVDNRPPVYIDAYWKQKTECPYNPYICKWENENGYIPVEECGTYSKETGFVPDRAKIKKLNKQLWEEDDDK